MIFYHEGDLGDLVAALPAIKALGGGEIQIGDTYGERTRRESMLGPRYEAIRPLLMVQPYIQNVSWVNYPNGATDFSTFRHTYRLHENLAMAQARHIGVDITLDPWLSIPARATVNHNRVVVARSSRYHNPIFPWRRILSRYPDALFVGLPSEHRTFTAGFGEVEYKPTKDLLELAEVISGASLVVCNQSCPFWISVGLGRPTWQETMSRDQNSIVERENCRYTRTVKETQELIDML